jgi:hypothetical protein
MVISSTTISNASHPFVNYGGCRCSGEQGIGRRGRWRRFVGGAGIRCPGCLLGAFQFASQLK